MAALRVHAVTPDPAARFAPDQLPPADFGEVVARYRMEVATDARRLSISFAVTVKRHGWGEEFVAAWPEYTPEVHHFLFSLCADWRNAPRWARVLSSVVESVHRGIERTFPTEFTYPPPPELE